MIFVSRHPHIWVPTMRFIHGCQVMRCTVCGDQAYKPSVLYPKEEPT